MGEVVLTFKHLWMYEYCSKMDPSHRYLHLKISREYISHVLDDGTQEVDMRVKSYAEDVWAEGRSTALYDWR